jgi:hypothetical protein
MSAAMDGGGASTRRNVLVVAAAAVLAWVGLWIHNAADLEGQTPFSPESAGPGLVSLVLLVLWLLPRTRRVGGWLLLGWALLNLVGGAILSVLPLPFLPFAPEQTLRHYSFHLLYGVCQLPLVAALAVTLRPPPRSGNGRPAGVDR